MYGCISWPDASGGQKAAKGTWRASLAGSVLVWQTRDHEFNLPEPSFKKKKSPQDGALVTLELGGFLGCDGQPRLLGGYQASKTLCIKNKTTTKCRLHPRNGT